jgi:hypothetical protein
VPSTQLPFHSGQPIRLSSHSGVLVREDTAFSNYKGVEKKGIRKRAEQALEKLEEPLRKFLEPDEAVLYIARGQIMPSGVEQFLLGWHAHYLAPGFLVLTNRRLLHLLMTRKGTWRRCLRSARWGDLEGAKVKGLLGAKLNLKYRDGKKEVYWGMRREDSNKIRVLLEALLPQAAGETSPALSMASLCPQCRAALLPGVYECPGCHLAFKDEKTALRRSLLIPGGGFFYTGYPTLGVLHSLVEVIVLVAMVFWILVALGLAKPDTSPGEAPPDVASAVVVVIFFAAVFGIDKWVMARVARKQVQNYIPAS